MISAFVREKVMGYGMRYPWGGEFMCDRQSYLEILRPDANTIDY
jgi:hypothetical protein